MATNSMAPFYKVAIVGSISNLATDERPSGVELVTGGLSDITSRTISISYDDADDKFDSAKIVLDNRDLKMIDTGLLFNGNTIVLTFGYPGNHTARALVIDGISGFEKLELTCIDIALKNNKAKTKQYKRLFAEQVADIIFEEFTGISKDQVEKKKARAAAEGLDIGNVKPFLVATSLGIKGFSGFLVKKEPLKGLPARDFNQAGQTSIEFLYRLAEKFGYNLYTKDGVIIFAPRDFEKNIIRTFTYFYGEGDVLSFSVDKFTIIDEPAVIDIRSRDPVERRNNSSLGSDKTTERKAINLRSTMGLRGDSTTGDIQLFAASKTITSPDPSKANNKKEADSHFVRAKEKEVEATLVIIGDPDIAATTMIRLEGFSRLLSGKWYVRNVTHEISASGYKSTLKLIRGGTISTKVPEDDKSKTATAKDRKGNETALRLEGSGATGNITRQAGK